MEVKMKILVIAGIVAGLLLISGIFLAGNITAQEDKSKNYECDSNSCPNYKSGCNTSNNCGLSTCGTVKSKSSSCSCGR